MKKIISILILIHLFSVSYSKDLWEKYLNRMEQFTPPEIDETLYIDLLKNRYKLPPVEIEIRDEETGEMKTVLKEQEEPGLNYFLENAINDEEGAIRRAALIYIVKNKLTDFSKIVVDKLPKIEDVTEKKLLIWAFGEIGNSDDVLAMVEYLRNERNPYILNLLAAAISKIAEKDGSIMPLILLVQNSNNLYVKSTSIIGLGKVGDPRALPVLWKLSGEHQAKEIRFCAILALSSVLNNDENKMEKINTLRGQFFTASSNYEKLAIAYTIQKTTGFDLGLYNFMLGFLKTPVFNEVALDLLEELPFIQGKDRLEIVAINYPEIPIKSRIYDLIHKLRSLR
ncbi:MAG TPA: hypothetical protein DHW82_09295 [Spirochaetia bacterium]|nr:MAG: hypothetical protein A2Y41_08730 [Spirochaetes bacterium GWB1_36_13]HCL57185.1 hypothetical protein [Spirochaetia bacterium]